MASGLYRPCMTIKHAKIKMNPPRIEYETYKMYRTFKKHHWVVPNKYIDAFVTLLEESPEIVELLQTEDGVNLSVWDDTIIDDDGSKKYIWVRWEINQTTSWTTDPIDRVQFPKMTDHRNDNETE